MELASKRTAAVLVLAALGGCPAPEPLSERDPGGDNLWTPLHEAAIFGEKRQADLLITAGAEVNARARYDMTPLHWAALKGQAGVLRLLCDNGADLDAPNLYGMTALHEAATPEVANVLLAAGAKLEAKDRRGMTPLHGARSAEIAEVLINAGANITTRARDGRTPVQMMSPMPDTANTEMPNLLLLPIRGMVRLRGDDSKGRVEVRNLLTTPLTNLRLSVTPDDDACSVTIRPALLERLHPAQRAGFDLFFVRTPGVKPGQRGIAFALNAELGNGEVTTVEYVIQLDTRHYVTPTDRGMVPLAQVKMRTTPSRWHLIGYVAAPLVLVLLLVWFRAQRAAPVPESETASEGKDDDQSDRKG